MPQPTFSTRKPPKLKRTKAVGAIVRDASARKNPVVNNSAETESSGNPAEGPIQSSSIIAAAHQRGQETESVVALRVSQFEHNPVDNSPHCDDKHKKSV